MDNLGSLGALGLLITLLAGVTSQVSEHLFGGIVSGKLMYWAVLATGVAIGFGAQVAAGIPQVLAAVPSLGPLASLPWPAILVGGLVTGFVATKLHPLLSKDSGTKDASLSGIVMDTAGAVVGAMQLGAGGDKFEPLTVLGVARNKADVLAVIPPNPLDPANVGAVEDSAKAEATLIRDAYEKGQIDLATMRAQEDAFKAKYPEDFWIFTTVLDLKP